MLGIDMYTTIVTLWEQGYNKAQIAEMINHDWKTVSKIIKNYKQGIKYTQKNIRVKKLDKNKEKILFFLEKNLSAVRIHEELIKLGINISYPSVSLYVRNLRDKRNICIRFNTAPGEEAQVDFGYVGLTLDFNNKPRKTWVFNMRLSYSRLDYYEVVYDQKVETFIKCHIHAFKYYNGCPKYIKIDNLKAAILVANFYEPIYQNLYQQFAEYYGFKPAPCRVAKPQEKGKTEAGIKYIKNNFFAGREFNGPHDLHQQLYIWLEYTCNSRIHGTTKKIPKEVFIEEENQKLIPLPITDFYIPKISKKKVYKDCHIFLENNYYSVPCKYVGEIVEARIYDNLIKIFFQNEQIALHERCFQTGNFITNNSHYPAYKNINSPQYQAMYASKMEQIGDSAKEFFILLLEMQPKHYNRMAQGIIALGKTYGAHIVNLACKRALFYGIFTYSKIKNICVSGSYNLPL